MSKNQYQLKHGVGDHVFRNGAVMKAGDVVESDIDLAESCPSKFSRFNEAPKTVKLIDRSAPPKTATAKASTLVDVTADFESAKEANVQVFRDGKKFIVIDADGETLTTEGPVTKAGASSLIDDLVQSASEAE